MTKVTLKDVAAKCGVTPTLVSAVLNNRCSRIRCSKEKRKLILETAQILGYRPNLLARSMVSRRSPVVAVMLHTATLGMRDGGFNYFNRIFPTLTKLLNARGLEVLFAPYENEEEQVVRAEHLAAEGIAGGIITNLQPHHYSKIAVKLPELRLPYVILGNPQGFDCHCAYSTADYGWLAEYARKHDFTRVVFVTTVNGKLKYYDYPFPQNYLWLAPELKAEDDLFTSKQTLFVCTGLHCYAMLPRRCGRTVIIEQPQMAPALPEGVPAALSEEGSSRRLLLTAQHIADWMLEGKEPEPKRCELKSRAKLKFINF